MIETKEEYAQTWALINGQDRQVAKDFHETIEALREVARAIYQYTHSATQSAELDNWQAIQDKLAALPDWLKDG